MTENSFTSFTNTTNAKGDKEQYHRLFVAPTFEPQKMPILFTTFIIILWAAVIFVCAIVFYTSVRGEYVI